MVKKRFTDPILKYLAANFWKVILLAIIVLGGYLRLWRIDEYMTFLGDEGRDVLVVKKMIVDHKLTLLGPTASVGGFFLGPLYYYLMLPFLYLFKLNPVGPAVMVGIFGTATIFLVYLLGKTFFHRNAGLIASALYAVSPVVINYSHSSWNPNLVPFFSSLFILLLNRIQSLKQGKEIVFLGAMFGIGLQLHYLFLFLAVVGAMYLWSINKKIGIREIVLFCLGFLLLYLPFILFEFRHNFINTRMIFRFIFTSGDTGFNFFHFISTVFNVTFRLYLRLVVNNDKFLTFITMLVSAYSVILFWYKQRFPKLKLFFLWFFIPVVLFGFYNKPIYDYYLGIIFPLPFLLVGNGLSPFNSNRIVKLLLLFLTIYLFFINWQSRPFVYQPNRQLKQTETVARFILEKADGRSFNFALMSGHNSDHAYRYFFEILGNRAVVIENPYNDPERKTVTEQLFVICEVNDCQPLGDPLWDVAGFGRAEIAGKWQVSVLTVYKLVPFQEIL